MRLFFTSDLHLGHFNIIRYCNRPFKSIQEMDDTLIHNINERVEQDDMLFHLGDFCFSRSSEASDAPKKPFDYYRSRIVCNNIIFLRGNHDQNNSVRTHIQSMVLYYGKNTINLTHYPDHAESKYDLNLVGHVHDKWKFRTNTVWDLEKISYTINVGVDVWNFRPVTFEEINSGLQKYKKENKNE